MGDVPGLKLFGDIDPNDVNQGAVGDCWLLSAISALAEFDGAVKRLFAKTADIATLPKDGANTYTITLYDLRTWKAVDVVVDERLAARADGEGLLGCSPSDDGELWPCYLEKAVAAHCGGWDNINGGNCTHAWSLLTGCKDQYTITREDTGMFGSPLAIRTPGTVLGTPEIFNITPCGVSIGPQKSRLQVQLQREVQPEDVKVGVELGRIVALYYHSSTSYHIR